VLDPVKLLQPVAGLVDLAALDEGGDIGCEPALVGDDPLRRERQVVSAGDRLERLAERSVHLPGAGETLVRVFLQCAPDHLHDRLRELVGRVVRRVIADAHGHGDQGVGCPAERSSPREHLEENHTDRPEVRPVIHMFSATLLGRHVPRGPDRSLRLRQAERRVAHLLGETEVGDLRDVPVIEQHVSGFQIAVQEGPGDLVRLGQRMTDLTDDRDGLREAVSLPAVDEPAEVAATAVLQDQIGV